jgi:hypothetical protein
MRGVSLVSPFDANVKKPNYSDLPKAMETCPLPTGQRAQVFNPVNPVDPVKK